MPAFLILKVVSITFHLKTLVQYIIALKVVSITFHLKTLVQHIIALKKSSHISFEFTLFGLRKDAYNMPIENTIG